MMTMMTMTLLKTDNKRQIIKVSEALDKHGNNLNN